MAQKMVAVHPKTYKELLDLKLKRSLEKKEDLSFNDIIQELLKQYKINTPIVKNQ